MSLIDIDLANLDWGEEASEQTLRQLQTLGMEVVDQLDRIMVEANSVLKSVEEDRSSILSRSAGADGGKKGGKKGGRPSAKPFNVDLKKAYDRLLAQNGSASRARAELVKESKTQTGAKDSAVRAWLRNIGC